MKKILNSKKSNILSLQKSSKNIRKHKKKIDELKISSSNTNNHASKNKLVDIKNAIVSNKTIDTNKIDKNQNQNNILKSKSVISEKKVENVLEMKQNNLSSSLNNNWEKLIQSGKVKYQSKEISQTETVNSILHNKLKEEGTVLSNENKIWFDDVDEILIDSSKNESVELGKSMSIQNPLVKNNSSDRITKVLGMDCEMVGVGPGGVDSILARVSIVNQFGQCIYDKLVRPTEKVTDYRTIYSGVRPEDLVKGENFKVVQKEVCDILKGKILVGHSIENDLKVLFFDHPHKMIRDTSRFKPFRAVSSGATPSLKKLAYQLLGVEIQAGEHDSIQDAQAAMRLYTMYKARWEASLNNKKGGLNKDKSEKKVPSQRWVKKKDRKIKENVNKGIDDYNINDDFYIKDCIRTGKEEEINGNDNIDETSNNDYNNGKKIINLDQKMNEINYIGNTKLNKNKTVGDTLFINKNKNKNSRIEKSHFNNDSIVVKFKRHYKRSAAKDNMIRSNSKKTSFKGGKSKFINDFRTLVKQSL